MPMKNAAMKLILLFALLSGCATYTGPTTEVQFAGPDGAKLAGTVLLPHEGEGPFPGVVLLHGAEAATRSMAYRMHANLMAERGFAVLLYDKRGAGESEGDHDNASFADFVEDALAAISFARSLDEVDPTRVGVLAASQSGWFTPEIAERAGGLSFVINKVGSPLSFRETVTWEMANDFAEDGVAEEVAREQIDLYRRIWAYRLNPTTPEKEELGAILAEWSGREDSQLPTELEQRDPDYLADIAYDPGPYLERSVTPMLYVYGAQDINIPARASVERLRELASRQVPVSWYVFEDEGHELGGVRGFPPMYRLAEGYEKLLGDFAESAAQKTR
jgi:hypothetical protein